MGSLGQDWPGVVRSLHYTYMQLNQSTAGYPDECRLSVSVSASDSVSGSESNSDSDWDWDWGFLFFLLRQTGNRNVDILIEARQVTCHNTRPKHTHTHTLGWNKRGLHIYSWRQTAKGKLDCNCCSGCSGCCCNKILNSNENTIDLLSLLDCCFFYRCIH